MSLRTRHVMDRSSKQVRAGQPLSTPENIQRSSSVRVREEKKSLLVTVGMGRRGLMTPARSTGGGGAGKKHLMARRIIDRFALIFSQEDKKCKYIYIRLDCLNFAIYIYIYIYIYI